MAQTILTENVSSDNAVVPSPVPAPFDFKGHQIRTVTQNGQPWFVARDVAAALEIGWSGHTLDSVPAPWRGMVKLTTRQKNDRMVQQNTAIISEPAVYKLAFRSNKPEAEEFTNWVASEVLPAIRKTGRFEAQPAPTPALRSTAKERNRLAALMDTYVGAMGVTPSPEVYKAAWRKIHTFFGVKRIEDLTVDQVAVAERFIEELAANLTAKALPAPGNPLPLRQILDDLARMMSMARKIDAAIYNRTLQIGTFAADRSPAQAEADRHMHGMPGQMLQSGVKMIEEGVSFLHRAAEGTEAMVTLSRREVG